MACWDGFGNLADGRPFWVADFNGDGKAEILFYWRGDGNWWLGTFVGNNISWSLCGNTAGFGNLADRRPIWAADFTGTGKADIVFYSPGDRNWWLGQFDGSNKLVWTLAGNTTGYGQVWDGRPMWVADFTGDGKADVLFYHPGDRNWWLGSFYGTRLVWSWVGNTSGFGQVADGRPFWVGEFTGGPGNDILFYFPGDRNWWLGRYSGSQLVWSCAGNTSGFGQVWDGRPFWTGDFSGDGKTDILFYFPGDGNWWRGVFSGATLNWNFAGNTSGFGNLADGRPIWAADFTGTNRADLLFYFPGHRVWWLGQFGADGRIAWNLAGNTSGFGQVWDGRPFWIGNFNGGQADVLFYHPGDGNWWLGSFAGNQLNWNFSGHTGRPYRSRLTVHFKILTAPTIPVETMLERMREVFREANIRVDLGSIETFDLERDPALQALNDVDVERCVRGAVTAEQRALFNRRNNVRNNEVVVYFVRSTVPPSNGCAAHPPGRPGAVVAQGATQWTLAHEVGHVLGLAHVNDNNRLMTGNGTANITNPPPDLAPAEINTMDASALTIRC